MLVAKRCAEFAPQGGKSNSKFFTSIDNRFVIILNVERVLSTEEITLLASMNGDTSAGEEQ